MKKAKRLGKAIEIRYQRDQGKHKGFYKHEVQTSADVVALEPGTYTFDKRVIVIRKRTR